MKRKLGLLSLLRRLKRDEHASILLQFTVYVVAIFGMIGLALDGGRFLLLNNGLQDLADAAAIAGAKELDGTSDALTRANNAARNLLNNDPRWSDVAGVQILAGTAGVQFYSQLNPDTVTTDPAQASFVKVTTGSWQVAPMFLVAVGAISNNSTSASAVAGTQFVACAPVQSYICGPSFPRTTTPGTMFQLLSGGSGGSGNWGIMDLPAGVSNYAAYFSQLPSACKAVLVDQRTGNGQHSDIVSGINVRFDQPAGNNVNYTNIAAPIVIDGIDTTGCGAKSVTPKNFDPNNYSATCNSSGSCPLPRTAGAANSNLNAYWQNHHGANWPIDPTTGQPISLYQAYQQEIAMTGSWRTDSREPHAPQCLPTNNDPARRILSIAILDTCPSGNSGGPYIFSKYAEFFLTEPAALVSGQPLVNAEYYKTYKANDPNGKLHQIIQLVR